MKVSQLFSETTSEDVMLRDVITLSPDDPLATAAAVLLQQQITGAPVVDRGGICVGVLSVTDILDADGRVAKEQRAIAESSFWNSNLTLPASVYAARLSEVQDKLASAPEQPVSRFMTKDLVSVSPENTLQTVVRFLVDTHVHRVVVLDATQRLVGIISATDVLAALLRADQESGAPAFSDGGTNANT